MATAITGLLDMLRPKSCPDISDNPALSALMKRQLQWHLFLRVVLLTILLGGTLLMQSRNQAIVISPLRYIAYFIVAVYVFTILSALLLNKTICYRQFAYLQILTDVFLTSFLVFFTGGSRSLFTIIYFFPIITGGLLLFRIGGLVMATLSTLFYGLILFFEYIGYSSVFLQGKASALTSPLIALHHFAVHGLIFFMVAFLTFLASERLRRAEAALNRTALDYDRLLLLYKQIFDDITTGIITVDNDGRITSFNRAAEDITGYSAGEVIGSFQSDLFPGLGMSKNETFRQVVELTKKNSDKIPVGYSWTKLNMPEGSDNSRVYTMQDLSQIKKMEDQVRQSEKMAAIGEMAAGVAHEFRNPLAAISGAAQIIAQEVASDPQNQRLMNIITRESDRLEATISDFLQFSKPVQPAKKWFSIKELVYDAIQVITQNPHWDDSCKFNIDIPDNLDSWADQSQIKQVLLNLIDNACSAMEGRDGEITIYAAIHPNDGGKEKNVITIANNGPPIPENIIDKIFEPFFTTRENGTGLGLAIVWQIIKSHGGTIKVGSRVGEGTAFVISLPLP